ncbi:hypothetical protein JHK85_052442 [Glycine max]|nr:hypothetical protein JHK85_052442 [Glycine max]
MEAMMGSLATEKEWRKGPWTGEEDKLLSEYVCLHGEGRWSSVAQYSLTQTTLEHFRFQSLVQKRFGLKHANSRFATVTTRQCSPTGAASVECLTRANAASGGGDCFPKIR